MAETVEPGIESLAARSGRTPRYAPEAEGSGANGGSLTDRYFSGLASRTNSREKPEIGLGKTPAPAPRIAERDREPLRGSPAESHAPCPRVRVHA